MLTTRITRAFLIEEQKIVKKVVRAQLESEKTKKVAPAKAKGAKKSAAKGAAKKGGRK